MEGADPRLRFCGAVRYRLGQPVHRLGRDQDGRRRHLKVQPQPDGLTRHHLHQRPARQRRVGHDPPGKFGQPRLCVENQYKARVAQVEQLGLDRVVQRFALQHQEQLTA